jgi:hypothetical protein
VLPLRKGQHFQRRKETKPRGIKKDSGKDLFRQRFGKDITEFAAFKRATEANSAKTRGNSSQVLPRFFLFLDEDPDTVIANRQSDITGKDPLNAERYERKTKAYIKLLAAQNKNVTATLSRIHGFFTNNSHRFSLDMRGFKYPKARKRRKYSPSNEDVRLLNSFADSAKEHFILAVGYQNGALPVDVAGLRVGDYPTEPWTYFEKSRSKTGEVWCGVSTPDACGYLKAYLLQRNGKIGEPLFLGYGGRSLESESVSELLRGLIEKAKLDSIPGFMPKCLRDGFEDVLIDARTYHKVKEALMGHTSGISHDYGSDDKREKRIIKAMQQAYPLLCLSDARLESASRGVFSESEVEKLKLLLARADRYDKIADMLERGELLHVRDPELAKRLKESGVL